MNFSDSDEDILVEDSRNLNDDSLDNTSDVPNESEEDTQNALNSQGVFIQNTPPEEKEAPLNQMDQFSKTLLDDEGIEIVRSGNEEDTSR